MDGPKGPICAVLEHEVKSCRLNPRITEETGEAVAHVLFRIMYVHRWQTKDYKVMTCLIRCPLRPSSSVAETTFRRPISALHFETGTLSQERSVNTPVDCRKCAPFPA